MKEVSIFIGHMEYITAIVNILLPFDNLSAIRYISPILVLCVRKTLAILPPTYRQVLLRIHVVIGPGGRLVKLGRQNRRSDMSPRGIPERRRRRRRWHSARNFYVERDVRRRRANFTYVHTYVHRGMRVYVAGDYVHRCLG
jgi:hypothetical protein